MLWLGLTARDFSVRPSRMIRISDEVAALDFDLAVSLRLFRFDNEKEKYASRRLAYEIWRMSGLVKFDQEPEDGD